MVQWSIDVLERAGCTPVVVAVPPDLVDRARELLPSSVVTLVAGGPTRQASVAAALRETSADRVLVQDASRPLIRADLVARVMDALGEAEAVVPALPVEDTLKAVTDDRVVETVGREGLWRAQTPQGFVVPVLRRAHERALEEGFEATDDAALIEHYGGTVEIVRGDRWNLKVTYPDDFTVAEALLGRNE
jgi:2-C-methyl-D-erythritol 4-phosphate cytidylyltransferase/2-C-methyl-D-erythritol 2,4-cyclodiphosphate synthase